MSTPPEARFQQLAAALGGEADVTLPGGTAGRGRKFGEDALKVGGKIFAMLTGDRLVLKLPKQRVDELVQGGHGECMDTGNGRRMKEWLSLHPDAPLDTLDLAREALRFVRPRPKAGA